MLTNEGKLLAYVVLFLIGIFACGYFTGWSRDKLSNKIYDKMIYYFDKVRYWQGRYEEVSEWYGGLTEKYAALKEYTLEAVGAEHVPAEFGGELDMGGE